MIIRFGWNNFHLKTIAPQELGLLGADWESVQIQYRIKYFHILYIPVFPLGTYWTIKINNVQYQPSAELMEMLRNADKRNFKWILSWSGIILPLLIFLFYSINDKMAHARWARESKKSNDYLSAFFADKEKNKNVTAKLDYIYHLTDSLCHCRPREEYSGMDCDKTVLNQKDRQLDTGTVALLTLYAKCLSSQQEPLTGYNSENTLLFYEFGNNASWYTDDVPDNSVYFALRSGTWNGYNDTGSVLRSIRNIEQKKTAVIVVEEKRANPRNVYTPNEEGKFISGYSYCKAYVYDLEGQKLVHEYKFLGMSSDKVKTIQFGQHERDNRMELEQDLSGNVLKSVTDFIFNRKKEEAPVTDPTHTI